MVTQSNKTMIKSDQQGNPLTWAFNLVHIRAPSDTPNDLRRYLSVMKIEDHNDVMHIRAPRSMHTRAHPCTTLTCTCTAVHIRAHVQ